VRLLLRAVLGPAPSTSAPSSPTKKANRSTPEGAKRTLDIHALVQKGAKSHHLHYTKIRVLVEPANFADAEQWIDQLMAAAYPGKLERVTRRPNNPAMRAVMAAGRRI
jgi:hypothetical protein